MKSVSTLTCQSINQSINQSIAKSIPKIAIVLPVYNTERYLTECLDSILSQTYPHFILFAIDDGSSDLSGNILDEYASKDPRIRVTHKPNEGVSSARNTALEQIEAAGHFDYVSFIDSDDYVSPVFLERFIPLIQQYNPDIAFCAFQKFDKTGPTEPDKILPKADNPYNQDDLIFRVTNTGKWERTLVADSALWNLLFSVRLLHNERFDTSISISEDTLFNLRITMKAHTGVYVDEILYFYRQRKGSLARNKDQTKSALIFCESFFDFPEQLRFYIAHMIFVLAHHSWRNLVLKEIDVPKDRIQRITQFIRKHIYRTPYDSPKLRYKYKKMLWPLPLFRFYIRYIRKKKNPSYFTNDHDDHDLFD